MLDLFHKPEFIVFTTRDYASATASSTSAATKRLQRLASKRLLTPVTRGVWANTSHPYFEPMACVPHLLGKEQGYVSFLSALHLHGVISQIPGNIQIGTSGRARDLDSPIGRFEFFSLKPELMQQGVGWSDTRLPYLIATAEKALFDVLYISTRKGRRFSSLPELDLTESGFRKPAFLRLLRSLAVDARIRSAIEERWNQLNIAASE